MKLIVACAGREPAAFLGALARTVPLQGAEVYFVHVVDSSFDEGWRQMAGHHWLGRHGGPHGHSRVQESAERSCREILDEAMSLSDAWPAAARSARRCAARSRRRSA